MCVLFGFLEAVANPISLNFQNIEVRAALQLLAEFNKVNIVVTDSVQGNITLNLENVEFNTAMTTILQAKNLVQIPRENFILIITKDELNNFHTDTNDAIPNSMERVTLNYAKAMDVAHIIRDKNNNLLSDRAQITVDSRSNTLLLKENAINLANIKELIRHLDVPVRQVMIEAQIIETMDNNNEIFGLYLKSKSNALDSQDKLFFDFNEAAYSFGITSKLPVGLLIDLELRASELEEKTKTLARPKIVTQDGQTAVIETGHEIPYTSIMQPGAVPITSFKAATLKLEVTPQITPNNMICMDLNVTDDSPSNVAFDGQVGINTTHMSTKILVKDGETIVLGGIFKTNDVMKKQGLAWVCKIPYLGKFFSFTNLTKTKNEVLVFVTPHIVDKP